MPESIEMPDMIELPYKEKVKLEYRLYPLEYDIETQLTWKSDNPQVVSVDPSGVITACGVGVAEVTVTAENGCEASCTVMVPTPEYYFVMWLVEGGFVAYPFTDNPIVSYDDLYKQLVISTDVEQLAVDPQDIAKFTLSNAIPDDPYSSIVTSKHPEGTMRHGGDYISFVNCRADMNVYLYTIGGILIRSGRTDDRGMLQLSMENLPQGIYIVKSEEITCKIIKQ